MVAKLKLSMVGVRILNIDRDGIRGIILLKFLSLL